MKYITGGQNFSFCYESNPGDASLFVEARVYDVTTGSPSFLGSVVMHYGGQGLYSGKYLSVFGHSYLVIALVYTDGTYTTIDTGRSPWCECFKDIAASPSLMIFNYGAFDQMEGMPVAANIYDQSGSLPVLATQVPLVDVIAGVYFGAYVADPTKPYSLNTSVYTDGTYMVVDTDRPSGSDCVALLQPGVIYNFVPELILTGQSLSGVLEGQC